MSFQHIIHYLDGHQKNLTLYILKINIYHFMRVIDALIHTFFPDPVLQDFLAEMFNAVFGFGNLFGQV